LLPPALRSPTININTDTDRKLRFSIHDSGSTTNFAAPRLPSGSVGILPSFSALECASGQLGRELPARPHPSSFRPVWIPFRHSVCFPLGFRGCVGRPSIVSASLPSTLSPALRLRVLDFERLRTVNVTVPFTVRVKDYHRKNTGLEGGDGPNLVARNYRALLYQATGLCLRRYSTRPTLNGPQGPQIWAG